MNHNLKLQFVFLGILLILASFFYLIRLGSLPLDDYDESGYALVAREMIQNNDYLTLTYLGKPWFEKPPLYFWLMAISGKIFGINEFAMRLPSAIFGIITIIFTYLITLELTKDSKIAFFSGLILITMPFFLAAARHSRMDVPVTAAIIAAGYFYLRGRQKPVFLMGIGPAIAIGFMLKSAIGFLAGPLILLWSIIYKDWRWFKNKYFWLGIVGAALIILPWHIYQAVTFGQVFLQNYFGYHLFQRATANILNNQVTLAYYLWVLWKYSQPWITLFALAAIFAAVVLIKKSWREKAPKTFLPMMISLSGALSIFLVFAAVKTRLLPYFTTIYPLAAIFLAITIPLIKNLWPRLKGLLIYGVLITLLAWGLATVFSEVFVRPKIYALDISKDEKAIGSYLARYGDNEPFYVFNWRHIQTLRYYSGRDPEIIQSGEEIVIASPPLWLILPTPLIEENPWLINSPAPFSGPFLTLVHLLPE